MAKVFTPTVQGKKITMFEDTDADDYTRQDLIDISNLVNNNRKVFNLLAGVGVGITSDGEGNSWAEAVFPSLENLWAFASAVDVPAPQSLSIVKKHPHSSSHEGPVIVMRWYARY